MMTKKRENADEELYEKIMNSECEELEKITVYWLSDRTKIYRMKRKKREKADEELKGEIINNGCEETGI